MGEGGERNRESRRGNLLKQGLWDVRQSLVKSGANCGVEGSEESGGRFEREDKEGGEELNEWLSREVRKLPNGEKWTVIGVKQHKTGTQLVATVSLDEEEDSVSIFTTIWLFGWMCTTDTFDQLFFKTLTWKMMRFLISTTGKAIYNPSKDLQRFHAKYKLPNITSQVATQVFETNTKASFTDAEKALVADYLAHTTATADRHYRLKTPVNAFMGLKLISKVAMSSESDSETVGPSCASTSYGTGALSSSQKLDEAQALNLFYQSFPVTIDGQSIKKKDRLLIAGRHER
ncbi:unnamed protein product [Coregonus sp. 'balchen']|nr:unnamed protein product [Coregonus sp. 'balchen']